MNKSISLMALLLVLGTSFVSAQVTANTPHSKDTGKVFESSAITGMVVGTDAPWWRRIGRTEVRNELRNQTRNETRNETRRNETKAEPPHKIVPGGSMALNASCIQAAVDTREDAVAAAIDSHAASIKTALSARKSALDQAWAMSEKTARKSAIENAWSTYKISVKAAAADFNSKREVAWKQYGTDAKACKAEVSADPTNANVDKLVMS